MSLTIRRPRLERQHAICEDSFEESPSLHHIRSNNAQRMENETKAAPQHCSGPAKEPLQRMDTVIHLESIILTEKPNS